MYSLLSPGGRSSILLTKNSVTHTTPRFPITIEDDLEKQEKVNNSKFWFKEKEEYIWRRKRF